MHTVQKKENIEMQVLICAVAHCVEFCFWKGGTERFCIPEQSLYFFLLSAKAELYSRNNQQAPSQSADLWEALEQNW